MTRESANEFATAVADEAALAELLRQEESTEFEIRTSFATKPERQKYIADLALLATIQVHGDDTYEYPDVFNETYRENLIVASDLVSGRKAEVDD